MGSKLAEWVVRTVMLVLAGLVTLSILGSIAALSEQSGIPGGFRERERPVAAPEPQPAQAQPTPEAQQNTSTANSPAEGAGEPSAVPAPPEEERPERWLEAIAYALLAIAGLLALLLILLWRGVRALGRIAEATAIGQQRN